jgi:hypothetical protein
LALIFEEGTSLGGATMPLSDRDKIEIEKIKAIVGLLDAMTVIEVKHILVAIQTHLDSCSAISEKLFTTNLSNTLNLFK